MVPIGEQPGGPHPKVPALAVPLGGPLGQVASPAVSQAPATQLPGHGQILPPDAPKDEHILPFKVGDKVMWQGPTGASPVEALVVAADGMVVGLQIGDALVGAMSKDCQPLAAVPAQAAPTKKSRLRQKAEEAAGLAPPPPPSPSPTLLGGISPLPVGQLVPVVTTQVTQAQEVAAQSKYKIQELLIGCAPLRHPAGHEEDGIVLLEDWLAPVCARVAEQSGVPHFGLVDFGKGRSLLVVEILKEVSTGKLPKVIICDSAFGKQAEAAIEALTPFAAKIYRRLG